MSFSIYGLPPFPAVKLNFLKISHGASLQEKDTLAPMTLVAHGFMLSQVAILSRLPLKPLQNPM